MRAGRRCRPSRTCRWPLLKAPTAPAGAPPFAMTIVRDVVAWVRAALKQPAHLPRYSVADLPNAADYYSAAAREGRSALIFVSDEAGGAVPAFSDGANWRRVTDRAVIS